MSEEILDMAGRVNALVKLMHSNRTDEQIQIALSDAHERDIAAALEEALTAETPDETIWNDRLAAGRAALARALRAPEKEKEK